MDARASRAFESLTFRQVCPASSEDESTGLRSRGSHVRIVRGAPTLGCEQSWLLQLPVKQSPLRHAWFESTATHQLHPGMADCFGSTRSRHRSPPRRSDFLRVAQLAAHVLWEHGVGSSSLSAETSINGACGAVAALLECESGGRRFDPDHAPQTTRARLAESADAAASRAVAAWHAGSRPASGTSNSTPRGGIGRRTGLRSRGPRACPFDSDRGDQHQRAIAQKAESKALIRPGSVVRIHLARPAHALSSGRQSTRLLLGRSSVRCRERVPDEGA
jgi:hypothetical protein